MKYAALVSRSVTIPGDERSRTHPGHGYPESTQTFTDLVEFKTQGDMEEWVKKHTVGPYSPPPSFRLIQYEELSYSSSVSITIKKESK